MLFIYWVVSIFAIFAGWVILGFISPSKTIHDKVNAKYFDNSGEALSGNFILDKNNEEILVVDDKSKKLNRYNFSHVSEILDIKDGDTYEIDNKKHFFKELPVVFVDGYVCYLVFDDERDAISAREKLKVIKSNSSSPSDSNSPLNVYDIAEIYSDVSSYESKKTAIYFLITLTFAYIGSNIFSSNLEKSRIEKAKMEDIKRAANIERACNDPSSEAIYQSYQFVRDASVSKVEIIRSTVKGRKTGDCKFKVMGAFEGNNAFGGRVRNYYVMTIEGNKTSERVRWYGGGLVLDSDQNLITRIYNMD